MEKQNKRLEYIEQKLENCRDWIVEKSNGFYNLNQRTQELLGFSPKTWFLFSIIETKLSSLSTVPFIMNNILEVGITEHDVAACHLFLNGCVITVIIYFLYNKHRGLVWKQKIVLKKSIIVKENRRSWRSSCSQSIKKSSKKNRWIKNSRISEKVKIISAQLEYRRCQTSGD